MDQNRRLARAQLLSAGFAVHQAESGKQALETFQAHPPDVVLLDVLMPGMDGFETLNMLDVSRSEHAELTPNLTLVDLPHLLKEVEEGLKQRLKVTGQRLEVTPDQETRQIWGDRDLLKRVLENLLDNCMRYAPSEGTISVDLRTKDGAYVQLRVRDQGPGVPVEFREKIFEKYAQLKGPAHHHTRGNRGLGLAFCRLAVEAHQGRIWVEDNAPKGSCFSVELPIGGPKA